jgi:diaminohydroxyphosphoribosylaminopyrimidine deaminase / 5-amino-6-(5-phosphoribosylamino)uracil reductase
MFTPHEQYILRCLELAKKGVNAAPNPMVGAVLVYNSRIIGEGWHAQYGGPHAEVACFQSVKESNRQFIARSVLYVSLEPCAHYGKTPPCTDLIIQYRVPKVIIGCADPFDAVNGKGIQKLKDAGIIVTVGVLEEECCNTNKRFFCMQLHKRPYIILKWAQTDDGITGSGNKQRLFISNETTNRLAHQWRSEESAVLIGFNTALMDNPVLDNRFWYGHNPVKVIIDPQLQLPQQLRLFTGDNETIVLNAKKEGIEKKVRYVRILQNEPGEWMAALHHIGIQSVLVEGGTNTHQAFINAGLWDEARVITATGKTAINGKKAPQLPVNKPVKEDWMRNDKISYYTNQK